MINDSVCIRSHIVCKSFVLMFLRNLSTSDCCGMCLCLRFIGVSGVINGFLLLYSSISSGRYVVSSLLLPMFDISKIVELVLVLTLGEYIDEYQNILMVNYLVGVGDARGTPTDRVLGW